MKKPPQSTKILLAALVLGGCSSSPPMPDKAWKVAPVEAVQHGGAQTAAGHFALGRYREGRGAISDAVAAYRRAVDADPGHVGAWSALGAALARVGHHDEALQALERAASLVPSASHLHTRVSRRHVCVEPIGVRAPDYTSPKGV